MTEKQGEHITEKTGWTHHWKQTEHITEKHAEHITENNAEYITKEQAESIRTHLWKQQNASEMSISLAMPGTK